MEDEVIYARVTFCLIKDPEVEMDAFFYTFGIICASYFCCCSLEALKMIEENFAFGTAYGVLSKRSIMDSKFLS